MRNQIIIDKDIVTQDKFIDLPSDAKLLYFYLNYHANKNGFVSNPKAVIRMVNVSEDVIYLLSMKEFIRYSENGIVISDWKYHNDIKG